MSADAHGSDAPGHAEAVAHHQTDDHGVAHHQTADHGDDHGDDHGHAHGEEPLGAIDVAAWGAGVVGVLVGVVIAACFALATGALTP